MRALWHQEIHYETRCRGASNTGAHFLPVLSLQLQHQSSNTIREVAEALNRMQALMHERRVQYHRSASCGKSVLFPMATDEDKKDYVDHPLPPPPTHPRNLLGSNMSDSPTVRSSSSGTTGSVQPMEFRRAVTWPMLASGSTLTTCRTKITVSKGLLVSHMFVFQKHICYFVHICLVLWLLFSIYSDGS